MLKRSFSSAVAVMVAVGCLTDSCRQPAACFDTAYDEGEVVRVTVKDATAKDDTRYGIRCPLFPLTPGAVLQFVGGDLIDRNADNCAYRAARPVDPLGSLRKGPVVCRTKPEETSLAVTCAWTTDSGCNVESRFGVSKMPRDRSVFEDGWLYVDWGGDPRCLPSECSRGDGYVARIERLGFVDAGVRGD